MDSDLLAVHTWKFEHYFYELYLAVNACVSLRSFWKNFTYFQRVGGLGLPRAVRNLKNLDIISTCSHMAVGWGFLGGSDAFFAVLRVVPELRRQFFGALDGEEFFAIEGSLAN